MHHVRNAWIFLSIGDAGGTKKWVSLRSLIASADANNHDIPNLDDLEESMSNLVAAGLVETDGERTRLTAEGVHTYKSADRLGRGDIERVYILGKQWDARGYPPAAPRTWRVGEEALKRAYGEYWTAMTHSPPPDWPPT
jgi:hypothetical protein